MDEKIINVLLEQYKERGLDLYALLDDSFFKGLPLDKKVDLIKKYASHISSGTSKTLSKKDIRGLVIDAALSGLVSGALAAQGVSAAGHYFNKTMTPIGTVAGAIALGTLASTVGTVFNTRRLLKNRQSILGKIDDVVKSPTDENALRVLIGREHQINAPGSNTVTKSNIGSTMSEGLKNIPKLINRNIVSNVEAATMRHNFVYNTDYKPGVDEDVVYQAGENAARTTHTVFEDSISEMKKNILGL